MRENPGNNTQQPENPYRSPLHAEVEEPSSTPRRRPSLPVTVIATVVVIGICVALEVPNIHGTDSERAFTHVLCLSLLMAFIPVLWLLDRLFDRSRRR